MWRPPPTFFFFHVCSTTLVALFLLHLVHLGATDVENRYEYRTFSHEEDYYPLSSDSRFRDDDDDDAIDAVDAAIDAGRRRRPVASALKKKNRDKSSRSKEDFCISGFCIDGDYKKLEMPAGEEI